MRPIKRILKFKWTISAAVAIAAGVGAFSYFTRAKPVQNFITVERGDIVQTVIVTGNTAPIDKIDLSFQRLGTISNVYVSVGDKITAGTTLIRLNSQELSANLAQAQASVDAEQAKLEALLKGTRPEDIRITKTKLTETQQDLQNDYNGVIPALNDAYAKTNDAVVNQISALFANTNAYSPQLSFSTTDSQAQIDAQSERIIAGNELVVWRSDLLAINNSSSSLADLDQALTKAQNHLNLIYTFLNRIADALNTSVTLSSTLLTTYKTSLTTALSQTNTAITNINNEKQQISSQKIIVEQNKNQLDLQLAGTTKEDIDAQKAAVAKAQANVAVADAQLNQTIIRSPIDGIISLQNGKVGETVAANSPLISVISENNLKIDANISEVDIGKISLGDHVNVSFDAFPGEIFSGSVGKIDPAETIVSGVVNFKITIYVEKPDPRLKSGLTANLSIETMKKTNILILPQAAIIQNDSGASVKKLTNGILVEQKIEMGINDINGNVEIVSGLSDGNKVLNVGMK